MTSKIINRYIWLWEKTSRFWSQKSFVTRLQIDYKMQLIDISNIFKTFKLWQKLQKTTKRLS